MYFYYDTNGLVVMRSDDIIDAGSLTEISLSVSGAEQEKLDANWTARINTGALELTEPDWLQQQTALETEATYITKVNSNLSGGLLSIPGADLTAVADTLIMTVPDGKILVPLDVLAFIRTIDNCTVAPTFSLGTSAGAYTDLVASVTPTFFVSGSLDSSKSLNAGDVRKTFVAGDQIYLHVTNGATATTLTGRILIVGMLIDA